MKFIPSQLELKSRRKRREEGQGLVEYALILVLVAVVVIVILATVGKAVRPIFGQITCVMQYRDKYAWVTPTEAATVNASNYGCNIRKPAITITFLDDKASYPAHLEFDIRSNEVMN